MCQNRANEMATAHTLEISVFCCVNVYFMCNCIECTTTWYFCEGNISIFAFLSLSLPLSPSLSLCLIRCTQHKTLTHMYADIYIMSVIQVKLNWIKSHIQVSHPFSFHFCISAELIRIANVLHFIWLSGHSCSSTQCVHDHDIVFFSSSFALAPTIPTAIVIWCDHFKDSCTRLVFFFVGSCFFLHQSLLHRMCTITVGDVANRFEIGRLFESIRW